MSQLRSARIRRSAIASAGVLLAAASCASTLPEGISRARQPGTGDVIVGARGLALRYDAARQGVFECRLMYSNNLARSLAEQTPRAPVEMKCVLVSFKEDMFDGMATFEAVIDGVKAAIRYTDDPDLAGRLSEQDRWALNNYVNETRRSGCSDFVAEQTFASLVALDTLERMASAGSVEIRVERYRFRLEERDRRLLAEFVAEVRRVERSR